MKKDLAYYLNLPYRIEIEPIPDTEFSALEKWYIDDPMVSEYYITGLTDACYGPFPDESDAEWKAK